MQQKLITFAVPCYNSAAYMRHCIETLLSAGEQAEIILVDDGSVNRHFMVCHSPAYPRNQHSQDSWSNIPTNRAVAE